MNNRKEIPWWVIVAAFIAFWPAGLVLLMINSSNKNGRSSLPRGRQSRYRKGGYRFDEDCVDVPYSSSDENIGARIDPLNDNSIKGQMRRGRFIRNVGIGLTVIGAIISSLVFLGGAVDFYYDVYYVIDSMFRSAMTFMAIGVPGLALTFWGNSMLGKVQRLRRYSQVIGDSREISLDRLAGAMGVSYGKVCDDIYKMIDSGYFDGYYIDNERRVLTCDRLGPVSARPAEPPRPKRETAQPTDEEPADKPEEPVMPDPADHIREINDSIAQPEVSEKITKLETLTRRIYNYTEAYPEKEKYARSFKEKYLPKTIKILEAYSRFENSGSSGANVRAAMKDVEAVLDVLISSFEKQLDMLYMDEALDVTTDIDVLESMIAGDGLGDSPFAAMQRDE